MKKNSQHSRRMSRTAPTLAEMPFRELVQTDAELRKLREKYATQTAEQRRIAAQWAYDSAHASMLIARALKQSDCGDPGWHDAAAPLAIDSEFAPAILTVGSLEYQYGRVDEAMLLFVKLTTFWRERTASEFIETLRCRYLRIQAETDHVQSLGKNQHAIEMLNNATANGCPWTRCNENRANRIYDEQHPEKEGTRWLPGSLSLDQAHEMIVKYVGEMVAMPPLRREGPSKPNRF